LPFHAERKFAIKIGEIAAGFLLPVTDDSTIRFQFSAGCAALQRSGKPPR
jgi:hypothetical protein